MAAKLQGRVTNVSDDDLGSSLDGDHAAGATSLKVQNAADFDEDGGSLVINDQQIVYTSCDDDTDTITLETGLAAAADDGDTVSVWDTLRETIAVDKHAEVDVGPDYADDIEATVSLHLVEHLVEGPRGDDGESVILELDEEDDEWKVVEILGLGGPGASGVQFYQDSHTVEALGPQAIGLTHQPIENSEHLYWNGLYQPAAQWSRDRRTITVPDAGGHLQVGDVLEVEYAYRVGIAAGTTVPYGSGGWKYLEVAASDNVDRSAVDFDDSAWATGKCAFGSSDGTTVELYEPTTHWTYGTAIWVRRLIPGMDSYTVSLGVDDEADIYWNGVKITSTPLTGANNTTGTPYASDPVSVPPELVQRVNVIAVRAVDLNVKAYLDIQVVAGGAPL